MERARFSLVEARCNKGWSQEELAGLVAVDPATVARWERGACTPRTAHLLKLCKVFGMTAQELGFEEKKAHPGAVGQKTVLRDEDIDEGDAYGAFVNQHFFLRLVRIVWRWPSHNTQYHDLQAMIFLELEENSNMALHDMNRRDALCLLASLPIEISAFSMLSSSSKYPNEDILAPCAAGIAACCELRRGKELAFVSSTISKYIPTLKEIAKASSSGKRKAAADLLVQCYLLKSLLAVHLENSTVSLHYAQLAENYCEQSQNRALQVLVARTEANAHDYAGRWRQAMQSAERAKYLLETNKVVPVSSLVASYVYAGLANYQAHNGQAQDALASLRKAHTLFFSSSDEPALIWVDHERGNLLLHDGLVYYYLGLHKKAVDSFEQIGTLHDCRATTAAEAVIDQLWAEIMREDSRDLEKCISLWKQGIQSAVAIQSEAQYEDGMAAYTAMRAAWPKESRIKELRDYAIHW